MTTTHAPGVAAEVIAVRPGPPLAGTVSVDGSKNAALPLLAAAAALGRAVRLSNVPDSTDVQILLVLLRQAGWQVTQPVGEPGQCPATPNRCTNDRTSATGCMRRGIRRTAWCGREVGFGRALRCPLFQRS
ncbi:UDP-N-acetylglucosamine 1-carboxyvinyltransferase [Streptomyces misionensis JCM 4497]